MKLDNDKEQLGSFNKLEWTILILIALLLLSANINIARKERICLQKCECPNINMRKLGPFIFEKGVVDPSFKRI